MRKKRILFVGEASFLATGFSTYWNEVLKRLHATGEFEIAELGSYTNPTDHRCRQVPWKFYPVAPDPNNKEAAARYNAGMPTAQFGEWCFDDVCLEFKPDVVCGIRDWWMDEFVLRSPFRKNFKFMWMPTIDGAPQRELWLDGYKLCDSILTYSKWGMNLLKDTGRQDTNLVAVASPGADIETFAPIPNKAQHKQAVGLPPDANIIGTVMRNQKRKLYVNLIEDFSIWLKKAKSKSKADMAQKTFLYLHTSYPDVGYDIGKAIRQFKVGKHVLMTYLCGNCNTAYPSTFKGEIAICRKCGQYKAKPPNATHHCPRNVLASIMNLFDLYVQYSICTHPDTPVLTEGGWQKIGDIEVDDKVVGRDGQLHRVYKTMRNQADKCFDVSVKCRPWTVTATDNHPWLRVVRQKGLEGVKNKKAIEYEYCRTDELQPDDLLAQAIPSHIIKPPDFYGSTDDLSTQFMGHSSHLIMPDFAEYLGLFVADGHANESNGGNRILPSIIRRFFSKLI